jgi:predicted transcriptional regulator
MSNTFTIRADERTERELSELTNHGRSRNAVVVEAIHEAYRRSVLAAVAEDSARLRSDPGYMAEVQAAREDMGVDDAW